MQRLFPIFGIGLFGLYRAGPKDAVNPKKTKKAIRKAGKQEQKNQSFPSRFPAFLIGLLD
jgi:hypothetical protein